jgi:hypothetical protein
MAIEPLNAGAEPMASYRIVSRADGTFGVETKIAEHVPYVAVSFRSEAEARKYIDRQIALARFRLIEGGRASALHD